MRVTDRDCRLLRDMALSHVLSRDQVIDLGYFASVTRANTRLRELERTGLIRRLATPYFSQSLYMATKAAIPFLGQTIGNLVSGRGASPRFLQHALATTNVRLALLAGGATAWRFEQQLRSAFDYAGRRFEVRPDGLAIEPERLAAIEVDLGHVTPAKFREKLRALDAFVASGECERQWHTTSLRLLAITTGPKRAAHLLRLQPDACRFQFATTTFTELGLPAIGGWS